MTEFIQSILVASAGFFSVGSIAITLLLLLSEDGRLKGLAYVLGYVLAYSLIGLGVIVFGSEFQQSENERQSLSFSVVSLVFGIILIFLGIKNWIKARKKEDKSTNQSIALLNSIDKMNWPKVFVGGMLISVINVKNLMLFLSAISIVYLNNFSFYFKIINVLAVTLVFCLTVILPVIITFLFPQKSKKILESTKQFLEAKRTSIGVFVPIVFGLFFVFNALFKLL